MHTFKIVNFTIKYEREIYIWGMLRLGLKDDGDVAESKLRRRDETYIKIAHDCRIKNFCWKTRRWNNVHLATARFKLKPRQLAKYFLFVFFFGFNLCCCCAALDKYPISDEMTRWFFFSYWKFAVWERSERVKLKVIITSHVFGWKKLMASVFEGFLIYWMKED